jgi:acetoacetate decarboxylase
MAYPKAPWELQGYALQTVQLLDVERVRPFIPREFEIVRVLPGKTVGGVYVSHYGSGSMLEYSELIVAAGLVWYSGQLGGWVSHIYVDNPDSVAGGRDIWGLPKELAEFRWEKTEGIASDYSNHLFVCQGTQTLCEISYRPPNFELQLPFSGNAFGRQSGSILLFNSKFDSRVGLAGSKLQVPAESPFASLGLEQTWLTLYENQLRLVVSEPQILERPEPAIGQV